MYIYLPNDYSVQLCFKHKKLFQIVFGLGFWVLKVVVNIYPNFDFTDKLLS